MENIKYIFSDFDGTISKHDVVHRFISTFSKGDWTITERQWANGEISSETCLNEQMNLVRELKKKTFDEFLNSTEIDDGFVEFYNQAKSKGIEIIILSDGFDYFIKEILKNYGINDIKIYSNELTPSVKNGFMEFKIKYPNAHKSCKIKSGTCKCAVAKSYTDNFIYIGDGLSDRCIARQSKILFAKKGLKDYCKNENLDFIPFENFGEISDILFVRA